MGREAEADKCVELGLQLNPQKPKLWYYKALFYASMRKRAEALEALRFAFQLAPSLKKEAKKEELFSFLRKDHEFKQLLKQL